MFDVKDHTAIISQRRVEAIVKPAFEFFEGTPYYPIKNIPNFSGAGVYALLLESTEKTIYTNCLPPMFPIYVGKAVAPGARQGKVSAPGKALKRRLSEHLKSISSAENLDQSCFVCRFMIFEGHATDMISAMESYLIRRYNPLWNSYVDGFGNHTPGKGRFEQSPSEWDTLHPGREFAKKCTGAPQDLNKIMKKIHNYRVVKDND